MRYVSLRSTTGKKLVFCTKEGLKLEEEEREESHD